MKMIRICLCLVVLVMLGTGCDTVEIFLPGLTYYPNTYYSYDYDRVLVRERPGRAREHHTDHGFRNDIPSRPFIPLQPVGFKDNSGQPHFNPPLRRR